MHWYLQVLRKYAVFQGRARRKEYWMFCLFNFLIAFGIGFVAAFVGNPEASDIISPIYALAVIIPGIAVGVRRMHDIGRSGWWILLPLVNLIMLCLNGKAGENQYGPDPKGEDAGLITI